MKLPLFVLAVFFALLAPSSLHAQDDNSMRSNVKVITPFGNYKGELIDISDTSVTMLLRDKRQVWIPAVTIDKIRISKPFFKTVGWDMLLGAGTGLFLVCSWYVKNLDDPDKPPFGWALLGGTALGTGVGCVYGAFDAAFVRVRIPIHKDLFLFQNARRKLSGYMY
jgi:hypothetical protein